MPPLLLTSVLLTSAPALAQAEAGEIFVSTTTPGLPITLDGVDTGEVTPSLIKGVSPGTHTVEVRQECAYFVSDIEVKPLQIARVIADPVEGTGTLKVTSAPPGAQVYLGDEVLGTTPLETWDLPCGVDHKLRVEAGGYVSLQRTIRVPAFRTTEVDFALERLSYGVLVVSVEPLDARIYLDGDRIAEGPVTLDKVQNGPHQLLISRDGYASWEGELYVEAEKVNRLDIVLQEGVSQPLAAAEAGAVAAGPGAGEAVAARPGAGEAVAEGPGAGEAGGGAAELAAEPAGLAAEPAGLAAEPAGLAAEPAGPGAEPAGLAEHGSAGADSPGAEPSDGAQWGRLTLNGAVTAAGIGAGVLAASSYLEAAEAFDRYLLVESDAEADLIYEDEVAPYQRQAIIQGAAGGVLLAGSAVLWLTTDYTVTASPRGIRLAWRW